MRQRAELMERDLSAYDVEEYMPSWRQRARRRLTPYRTPLSLLVIAVAVIDQLNSALDWGLLDGRTRGVAALALLVWLVFLLPSRGEVERRMREEAERVDRG